MKSTRGFTLVELMMTILIIIIIAGIGTYTMRLAITKSKISRAKAEIKAMELALEEYKIDHGQYRPSSGGSTELWNALRGSPKIYFARDPVQDSGPPILDPFGNEYQYRAPGANNTASFDLWSRGPDGVEGTDDDITNWMQL
jgi:general secretion pathway protein G